VTTPARRDRDPVLPSLVVFGAIVVAGFVVMGLGWRIVARTLDVYRQLPAIISAGVGGLALVIIGAGLFVTQLGRRRAAAERSQVEAILDELSRLVAAQDATDGR
jgi:hypothetical protein